MSLEKESLTHKIEDDLALRNRNWDKLTSHLAETAKKHITESGSNANGEYVRFDDGTQICYRTVVIDMSNTDPQLFNFPATFAQGAIRAGGYSLTSTANTAIDAWIDGKGVVAVSQNSQRWEIRIRSDQSSKRATLEVALTATGRWK